MSAAARDYLATRSTSTDSEQMVPGGDGCFQKLGRHCLGTDTVERTILFRSWMKVLSGDFRLMTCAGTLAKCIAWIIMSTVNAVAKGEAVLLCHILEKMML